MLVNNCQTICLLCRAVAMAVSPATAVSPAMVVSPATVVSLATGASLAMETRASEASLGTGASLRSSSSLATEAASPRLWRRSSTRTTARFAGRSATTSAGRSVVRRGSSAGMRDGDHTVPPGSVTKITGTSVRPSGGKISIACAGIHPMEVPVIEDVNRLFTLFTPDT